MWKNQVQQLKHIWNQGLQSASCHEVAESMSRRCWMGLLTPWAIIIDDWKSKAEVFSTQNEAESESVDGTTTAKQVCQKSQEQV